jgi:hypothetical protein
LRAKQELDYPWDSIAGTRPNEIERRSRVVANGRTSAALRRVRLRRLHHAHVSALVTDLGLNRDGVAEHAEDGLAVSAGQHRLHQIRQLRAPIPAAGGFPSGPSEDEIAIAEVKLDADSGLARVRDHETELEPVAN